MTADSEDEAVLRPFSDILRELGGGTVADDCAVQLADLVRAVAATGRKGSLTLRIEVGQMKGTSEMLVASAKITARAPESDPVASVFWSDTAGNLVRDNPAQQALFPRPQKVAEPDARISGGSR